LKFIANPYDDFAVEEALKTKEKAGAGEVVIVSFGNEAAREPMIKALAMGADRALLVSNEGLEHADSLTVAKILAKVAQAEQAELVFVGKQAIDDDNMHVGTMVAELLGWPSVNVVTKFALNGKTVTAEREVEGGQVEVYEVGLPAVFGAHKALNTPRFTSLPGIMKAKKKPFDVKKPGDLGIDVGSLKVKVQVKGYNPPPEKPAGQIFKGEDIAVMAEKVVKLLREQAKVI
jgi:electron transfer flavoprotein beta subunit